MGKKKKKMTKTVAKPARPLRDGEVREVFRKYFIKLNRKLKLGRDLEGILWLHLKATKTDKPELFSKGIENFGYKL